MALSFEYLWMLLRRLKYHGMLQNSRSERHRLCITHQAMLPGTGPGSCVWMQAFTHIWGKSLESEIRRGSSVCRVACNVNLADPAAVGLPATFQPMPVDMQKG